MKHLYIILLALLACCPEVIHAENEISYLAEIGIQNRGVVKKGREVQLTMLVDLSELKIKAIVCCVLILSSLKSRHSIR